MYSSTPCIISLQHDKQLSLLAWRLLTHGRCGYIVALLPLHCSLQWLLTICQVSHTLMMVSFILSLKTLIIDTVFKGAAHAVPCKHALSAVNNKPCLQGNDVGGSSMQCTLYCQHGSSHTTANRCMHLSLRLKACCVSYS